MAGIRNFCSLRPDGVVLKPHIQASNCWYQRGFCRSFHAIITENWSIVFPRCWTGDCDAFQLSMKFTVKACFYWGQFRNFDGIIQHLNSDTVIARLFSVFTFKRREPRFPLRIKKVGKCHIKINYRLLQCHWIKLFEPGIPAGLFGHWQQRFQIVTRT